jgi:cell shape-determining protein MreC
MIKEQENVKHLALKLTNELFKNIVNRITRNVILKFYNFVYVPLQSSELLNRLQRRFCSLKDDFISELFQPSQLKEKLKREENKLNNRQKRLSELEQRLTNLRTAFTSIQI